MKTIPLSQGKCAIVDDIDYAVLVKYRWYAGKKGSTWYAMRSYKGKKIYMHRYIMGLFCYNKNMIDHINHNGLDNRRINLRLCTCSQNHRNRIPTKKTSKYKGVSWNKQKKRWRAFIYIRDEKYNYRQLFLGQFGDEVLAAEAYDNAAKEYYKEFAYTNF